MERGIKPEVLKACHTFGITPDDRMGFINQIVQITTEWNFKHVFYDNPKQGNQKISFKAGICRLFDRLIVKVARDPDRFRNFCDQKPTNCVTLMDLIDGTLQRPAFSAAFRDWENNWWGSEYPSMQAIPFTEEVARFIVRTPGAQRITVYNLMALGMLYDHMRQTHSQLGGTVPERVQEAIAEIKSHI